MDDISDMKSRFLYNGKKVVIHTHDESEYIARIINTFHKFYEWPLLEHLKQYNPRCFVDIGANIGNHSLFFHMNGTTEIHAFEPQLKNFDLLELNCPFANIYNVALGNELKNISMDDQPLNMGSCRVVDGKDTEMRLLDMYNLKPDLIKIDVEDMEVQVIEGAIETLKKHKPRLVIEHSDLQHFYNTYRLLKPLGYKVKPFVEKHWEVFEYEV
jgi:FkbM family methyltransferase